MKAKILVYALPALILAVIHPVEAQQPKKVHKIGWVSLGSAPANIESFLREFRKLGYVEGKNITIESRYANDSFDRLPALADELVRLKVDVLVTTSLAEALAAKDNTRTIPIVLLGTGDPVAAGLVDSLARPGGNITGVTTIAQVMAGKRLELLKETVPKLFRVAVLWNPHILGVEPQWKEGQLAALVDSNT